MSYYMVSYDLNKIGKNYDGVFQAIKNSSDGGWWHFLDSLWIISSPLTPQQISDNIRAEIDNDDHFIVVEVRNRKQGWLPKKEWEKLNGNVFK